MNFVLDNSVVMRWLFNDGGTQDRQYAEDILNELSRREGTSGIEEKESRHPKIK